MKKIILIIALLLLVSTAYARMSGVMLSGAGTKTAGAACTTSNDSVLTQQTSSDTVTAAIHSTEWRGNGFAVSNAFDLTAITVKMDNNDSTSSCTYTMYVYPHNNIYATGLVPYTAGGALATSTGILGSNLPESGDIDFVFSTPVSLPAGQYFLAVGAAGTGCLASLNYYAAAITYNYGIAADSHAGANTWVADPASVDYFKVNGCAGAAGTVWHYSGTASNPPATNATGSNTQGEMAMMLLPGAMSITKASFNIHTVGSATSCKWAIVNNDGDTEASGTFTPSTGWNDVSFTAFDSVLSERIYVAIQCNAADYKYGTDSTVSSYYCSPDYADFTGAACYSNVVDDGLGISVRLGY